MAFCHEKVAITLSEFYWMTDISKRTNVNYSLKMPQTLVLYNFRQYITQEKSNWLSKMSEEEKQSSFEMQISSEGFSGKNKKLKL